MTDAEKNSKKLKLLTAILKKLKKINNP